MCPSSTDSSETAECNSLRSAILETATRLFIDHGYNGVAMRDIAEKSGASKALLYYHFHSKADLFYAILADHLQAAGESLEKACSGGSTARQQTAAFLTDALSWPPERRAVICLAKQEIRHLDNERSQQFLTDYHARFTGQVENILAEGMRRGELIALDSALAARMLLGMTLPFLLADADSPAFNRGEVVAAAVRVFFDGLQVREGNINQINEVKNV